LRRRRKGGNTFLIYAATLQLSVLYFSDIPSFLIFRVWAAKLITKTAGRRRGRQSPDDQCDLDADIGRLRVTTAQPNEQEDTEIEEFKEVAPFPVDIDP
jgi:hypothetical protein